MKPLLSNLSNLTKISTRLIHHTRLTTAFDHLHLKSKNLNKVKPANDNDLLGEYKLNDPRDFQLMYDDTLTKLTSLDKEAEDDERKRKLVEIFDNLSNTRQIKWEDSNLNPNSKTVDREYMETIKPDLPATFNLATYANHLDIIGQLVKLDVKVYKLEENRDIAKFILTLDFDRDVKPYLQFLIKCGLQKEDFGDFLTSNFKILQQELENLEKRLEYYKRMKFGRKEIRSMIIKYPKLLNYPIEYVDSRLGYVQRAFKIKPEFVRQMMVNYPELLRVDKLAFDLRKFVLVEQFGFKNYQMKEILINGTQILGREDNRRLVGTLDYIWNNVTQDRNLICSFAWMLDTKRRFIEERDRYLKLLGRAQYDPTKPLYVPLSAFAIPDEEFLEKYCKTTKEDFFKFVKTL